MYPDAAALTRELVEACSPIAIKYGGAITAAPIKGEARAAYQAMHVNNGDWYSLDYIARIAIIVPRY